jgi:hypothetical protein
MHESKPVTNIPAGHKRDEQLKINKDALDQKADTKAATLEVERIDPDAFRIDREIAAQFDELFVANQLPDYHYCWVNSQSDGGKQIRAKLAFKGWEIVHGDMPEAPDLKDAAGNRRLGDVLLMRIKKERYNALLHYQDELVLRQQQSITSNIKSLGDKYRGKGITVHDQIPDKMMKSMEASARGAMAARTQLDTNLRDGNIAGL